MSSFLRTGTSSFLKEGAWASLVRAAESDSAYYHPPPVYENLKSGFQYLQSPLYVSPAVRDRLTRYLYWLCGQRAAGNVAFAEVLATCLDNTLTELVASCPYPSDRYEYPPVIWDLQHGEFFNEISMCRLVKTREPREPTVLVSHHSNHPLEKYDQKRYGFHYKPSIAGSLIYHGPQFTEDSFMNCKLPEGSPFKLWTVHT